MVVVTNLKNFGHTPPGLFWRELARQVIDDFRDGDRVVPTLPENRMLEPLVTGLEIAFASFTSRVNYPTAMKKHGDARSGAYWRALAKQVMDTNPHFK